MQLPLSDGQWCYSRPGRSDDPPQGWKLHVSATRLNADQIFARVAPILFSGDVLFKVPARLGFLAQLNVGIGQFSQVGKFLTAYPRSDEEAVELARQLHSATRNFRGPEIPYDVRYRTGSCVYYRYGSFRRSRRNPGTILDNRGRRRVDRRTSGAAIPPWLDDPFETTGRKRTSGNIRGPIGTDILAFKVMARRGKGGVYEAVDMSASPARLVIIKEGHRHGETAWNGDDGYARVKHEGRVLRALRKAGAPVPNVLREFTQNGSHYIVLEKLSGRPLLPRLRQQPARFSWRRSEKLLAQLQPLLSRMHAAGWVWRDCKPSHIFVDHGEIRLVDFEGACRLSETQMLPWGSANYSPRRYHTSFTRSAGTLEDDYALGVIVFQFGTGRFPAADRKGRAVVYRRTKCPEHLVAAIERLLHS